MQKPGVAVLVNLKETWQAFEFDGHNYYAIASDNYVLDHERRMRKTSMHIQITQSHDLEKLQSSIKAWNFYYNLSYIMFASNREIEWFERDRLQASLMSWFKKSNVEVEEAGAFLNFYGDSKQLKYLIEDFVQQYEDIDLSLVNDIADVQAYPVKVVECPADIKSETVDAPLVPVEALRDVNGLAVEDVPSSDLDNDEELPVEYDEDDEDHIAESMVMSMLEENNSR